jgi:AraC-like DNA-binding protein
MIATSRIDSPLGSWTTSIYTPSFDERLARIVRRVWLFNGTTTLPRERIFPDGTLEIVFQLDATYRPVGARAGDAFPQLSVGGIRTRSVTIEGPGRPVRVLGIRLRPAGAFALLRTSLYDLTDLDFDLHDVAGRSAAELAERCADARDDRACIAAAIGWIRVRAERAPEPEPVVTRVVAELESDCGDVAIAELQIGGMARNRLTATFRDQIGVTPKRYARILRFRHALELLRASDASVGTIAARAGYYDQPHMNAEFRTHAGIAPQAFRFARHYPDTTSLAEDFLQDGDPTTA